MIVMTLHRLESTKIFIKWTAKPLSKKLDQINFCKFFYIFVFCAYPLSGTGVGPL
jgi:hypothetical protein